MDRRFSLGLMLFAVVMVVWIEWKMIFRRPPPKPPAEQGVVLPPPPDAAGSPPPPERPVVGGDTSLQEAADEQILVDTDIYRARFSNRGAVLVELFLKTYFRAAGVKGDLEKEADPANWLPLCADMDPSHRSLLLRRNSAKDFSGAPLDTSNWQVERKEEGGATELTFRMSDGAGTRVEKVFHFTPGRYTIGLELRFFSEREGPAQGTSGWLLTSAANIPEEHGSKLGEPAGACVTDEDVDSLKRFAAKELKDGPRSVPLRREELPPFYGSDNNYFAVVASPDAVTAPLVDNVTCERVFDLPGFEKALKEAEAHGLLAADKRKEIEDAHWSNARAVGFLRVPNDAKGSPPRTMRFEIFAGPRSPSLMEDDSYAPYRVLYDVQYGSTFRWINRVLLIGMRWVYNVTGNWGVAIILLTLAVKVLLFPLNRMQSRTMEQFQKKMKLLQPQLDELKKKYKGNMQKMNQEQQRIMREHGVRPPVFGCLVVFLQMPVWYGMFQIMRSAPELRQAPFFGWIKDLSAPDVVPLPFQIPLIGTLHLLPILMVVAWLVQNRMMPKPSDPQQAQMQKMMNFFPFVFGFMLYNYASGQSLYMLTNSLLGMAQMKLLKVTPTN